MNIPETKTPKMNSFACCSDTKRCKSLRFAFTLVELLVVIAIIGILVGIMVPAMQNMRELSRRSNCEQNLSRLSLALSAYNDRYGQFPIGTIDSAGPIKSQEAGGYHHNWLIGLLPMLDARSVAEAVDTSVSVYDDANAEIRALAIPGLRCPSASGVAEHTTCYAGICSSTETPIAEDNDGVFRLNLPIRENDIKDGFSHTLFVGEKVSAIDEDLGWVSGTRSSLRNTGHPINAELVRIRAPASQIKPINASYVGGLASDHPGGAYLLMGSGEIKFRSTSMDTKLLAQLASRADGEIPMDWKITMPVKSPSPVTAPAEKPKDTPDVSAETEKAEATGEDATNDATDDATEKAEAEETEAS